MARAARRPTVEARFGDLGIAGGYESFYVRAVDPKGGRAVWLRNTVQRARGSAAPVGSIWLTMFDIRAPAPVAHKAMLIGPRAADWLQLGDCRFGPHGARGTNGPASWELRWQGSEAPLRHLPYGWMYRTPFPRTKPESPLPVAVVDGRASVGDLAFDLEAWPGMVGHNWGAQHAERWIWLHGMAFEDRPDAWLDLSLGRLRIGGLITPWLAAGTLSVGGRRIRLDVRSRPHVRETPTELALTARAEGGGLELVVASPAGSTVVWRYGDPDGGEHHVANCSLAGMEATWRPRGGSPTTLRTVHGGAYELGMRETTHGLPVQPYDDP